MMDDRKKMIRNLKIGNDLQNDTGIVFTIMPPDDRDDSDSLQDMDMFPPVHDPVSERRRKRRSKTPTPMERPKTPETAINPSISIRMDIAKPRCFYDTRKDGEPLVKYVAPKMKGTTKAKKERTRKDEEERAVCEFKVLRIPSPFNIVNMSQFNVPSPEVSKVKVMPKMPSFIPGALYPYPPTEDELDLHKPHSGIFINPKEKYDYSTDDESDTDETMKKYAETGVKKELKSETERLSTILDEDEADWEDVEGWDDFEQEGEGYMVDKGTAVDDDKPLRHVRKVVSQLSIATSLNEKELPSYKDLNWDQIPAIYKLVQTFRTEQEPKKRKKIKRGSLENHSFTKIKQRTLDEFCFKALLGTIHQGDDNFSPASINRQGICMPIAAFCYSKLIKPSLWSEKIVDEVVETGDKLYVDSTGFLHMHKDRKELSRDEVQKFCVIDSKKVKYVIDDPEINGHVRSEDKRVYNISKGLKIFFLRHKAALFQANGISLAIWKSKKYFYIFDANPRRKDLYEDPNGKAILMCVQSIPAITSVLLDRTNLGNSPFLLSKMHILKVVGVDDKEEDLVDEKSEYNILDDKKAVVNGTYDLGDKCFLFTRNKQALTMAVVSLVYSRITSPHSWRRKTIDKIMIIGNQLFQECVLFEKVAEIGLEHLPALFTVGPYIVEIFVYANCFADTMYKKGQCSFHKTLEIFFKNNNNAIVQIGKFTLGVWHQRNSYFCFDPYSRNTEGLKCRNGSACVSMHNDLESLVDTVVANFSDKDAIFYLHALKVIKIHRDPAMNRLFPKTMMLNEVPVEQFKKCRVRKGKKKAVEKPIKVDFTEYAMKKLIAGDEPGASLTDIGSTIGSIDKAFLSSFFQASSPKEIIKTKISELDEIADLDSPALSETQISPDRPTPIKDEEEITFMDLDSFDLTQEELELQEGGEEEGIAGEDEEGGEGEEDLGEELEGEEQGEEDVYFTKAVYSQVASSSLESMHRNISEEVNTDITYRYKILPALELPYMAKMETKMLELNDEAQKAELEKETAFKKLPDDSQIIQGTKNIADVGEDVNEIAPYICVMVIAYSKEEPLHKWTRRHIDFLLKSGMELYQSFETPYQKVEDFHLEFTNCTVDITLDTVFDTHVGKGLFDTIAGQNALEAILSTYIFSKHDCGFIVTPKYSCGVFLKRNLLYLFECFGCDDTGKGAEVADKGTACLLRFKTLEALTKRLLNNRKMRFVDDDSEYTHIVLVRPDITRLPAKQPKEPVKPPEPQIVEAVERTQSQELALDSNFVDLPDGTQLIRGSTDITMLAERVDLISPYVCIMAATVGNKYGVATWSGDIVDYVLICGSELHKKSKVQFEEVAKLDIPRISLGQTDFSLEVRYMNDAPMMHGVVESTLKKVLKPNADWAILTTQEYACATFLRNGLYYLYDAYATNEVGLSEGVNTSGFASFARFKDLNSLVTRIIYNKTKREEKERLGYTRFVLTMCKVKQIAPESEEEKKKKRAKEGVKKEEVDADDEIDDDEELELGQQEGYDEPEPKKTRKGKDKKVAEEGEEEATPKNKVGFQNRDGRMIIEGTQCLTGKEEVAPDLKEDHFVCLCVCLMVINCPIKKWDTRKVDQVMNQGKHIYTHAENKEVSDKRTIKNILVNTHYFDIIVKPIKIFDWKKNKNIDVGLKTILEKRKFCLVQFPNCCIVVYKENDLFYLFNPYSWTYKTKDDKSDKGEKENTVQASWTIYRNLLKLRNKVKSFMVKAGDGSYAFYSFDVISVRKAPRKVLIGHKLEQYEVEKPTSPESIGKPFYEQETWLRVHQNPWSRMRDDTACGKQRGKRDAKWHNWDIEYDNDLYSIVGTLHQTSRKFKSANRGNQTLANLVVAIGMTNIYELSEWNAAILDSILVNGDHYFTECVKNIKEENYEMELEDLLESSSIFPYTFKVAYSPAIEGTMFLEHVKKFNLYKALRYFFENYESRCGMIVSIKGDNKRWATFGKIHDSEYFMYDCQAMGPPMFFEREGFSYCLRCTTLARLLHCLVLTLKGGDFYIYDVETYGFEPIS